MIVLLFIVFLFRILYLCGFFFYCLYFVICMNDLIEVLKFLNKVYIICDIVLKFQEISFKFFKDMVDLINKKLYDKVIFISFINDIVIIVGVGLVNVIMVFSDLV